MAFATPVVGGKEHTLRDQDLYEIREPSVFQCGKGGYHLSTPTVFQIMT